MTVGAAADGGGKAVGGGKPGRWRIVWHNRAMAEPGIMAAGASGRRRRPAGAARLLAGLALLAVGLLACGGGEGAGLVRGLIVEVVDRPAAADAAGPAEIETLRLRDADGRLWTFTTEGPLDKDGAHLRLHQLLGESILALYERRNGRLVLTALRD